MKIEIEVSDKCESTSYPWWVIINPIRGAKVAGNRPVSQRKNQYEPMAGGIRMSKGVRRHPRGHRCVHERVLRGRG